jgi:hypothetical protein
MIFKDIYSVYVLDNNDPDKANRIKIYSPQFMKGMDPDLLPWAKPWISGGTGGSKFHGSSYIPEVNSKVWVWFADNTRLKHPYYLANAEFKEFNCGTVFEKLYAPYVKGGSSLKYPHVKFTAYKSGVCEFVSSDPDNAFWGIIHNTGKQIIINKAGEVFVGEKNQTPDKVVSEVRIKNYFAPRVGNLGAPLFPDIGTAKLGFDTFFGGVGSDETPPPVVIVPPSDGQLDGVQPGDPLPP